MRLSADKGRLVADLVRGKTVDQALNILSFTPKKARAASSRRCSSRAIANAEHNDGADIDELKVKTIHVEQGAGAQALPGARQGPRQPHHASRPATSTSTVGN